MVKQQSAAVHVYEIACPPSTIFSPGAIESFHPYPPCAPIERTAERLPHCEEDENENDGDEDDNDARYPDGREKRVKLAVFDATRTDGWERDYGVRALRLTSLRTTHVHDHESRARQPRPGATARGVCDVPLTPILYLARRGAFPALRYLSSFSSTSSSSASPRPPPPPPQLVPAFASRER